MRLDDDIDLDALDRRFEDALARSRELPRALSPDEIATLALPPFWTEPALRKVLDQPGAVDAVIEKAGPFLHVEGDAGHRAISVRDPDAPTLVANLRSHRQLDRWAAIGGQIADLDGLPPVLSAWAELTRQLGTRSDYDLSHELLDRVATACDGGRPGDVHDLVDGAIALARCLGPPLSGAVRVAQHRIQRWYSVQRDRRKLAHFVPRPAALAALDRVLDDRDPGAPWALHVVGAAGMGKTSLIRHLAVELAAERGLQVARIDFDHLSPAYPSHEPGQLIANLAYELTALIETESQDKLIGFVESALDQLRDLARPAGGDLHALLDSREMQELMAWFGSLLQSFARPVLVLDTCEELTKLEVTGGVIPSVEATFLMLERLHAQAPQLRVVLAGRRLLAGRYANWTAPDAARPTGVTAARPFLTLHELRGFDADEARSYLDRRLPAARRSDEPLIAKLLALSPEPSRVSALAAEPDAVPHYNPFDLARHAEWVEADPAVPLTAFERDDSDPYVEVRIMQRMGELEPLLPAIALLRRFDLPMLVPALPAGDPQAMFDQLARHEWLRTTHLRGRTVLEVDRGLPDRIERCLAAHRPLELARARTLLGGALRRMVETGSLMAIPVEVHDAALRILPPDDAAALWQSVEARIGDEADWAWCAALTEDLAADGRAGELVDERNDRAGGPGADDQGPRRRELVALAIRATYASAVIHTGMAGNLEALWCNLGLRAAMLGRRAASPPATGPAASDVSASASPAWWLRQRARLGLVAAPAAAGPSAVRLWTVSQGPSFPWESRPPTSAVAAIAEIAGDLARAGQPGALATSRLAVIEAVVEAAERDPEHAAPELAQLIDHLAFDQPALAAFAVLLRARIEALVSPAGSIPVLPDPVPALPATVLDWRPPDSLRDRLRLELVRWFDLLDAGSDPALRSAAREAASTWRTWAEAASPTIDGDRLCSAVITVLGSTAPTTTPSSIDAGAEPRCAAHRQFPPLAFAQGRAALARGELSKARATARQLPRPWAQRLSCEIARWTRLPDDLFEDIFIDGLDPETTAAIDTARQIVTRAVPPGAAGAPRAPSAPPPILDTPLERLHPDLRAGALHRQLLRGTGLELPTERAVIAAIEAAELVELTLPDAGLRLFRAAHNAALTLGLPAARLRAAFGAWLAVRQAWTDELVRRLNAVLDRLLAETSEELREYRDAIRRARDDYHRAHPDLDPGGPLDSDAMYVGGPPSRRALPPEADAKGLDDTDRPGTTDGDSAAGLERLEPHRAAVITEPEDTAATTARTRPCPYCGANALSTAPACAACGRPLPPMQSAQRDEPAGKTMFGYAGSGAPRHHAPSARGPTVSASPVDLSDRAAVGPGDPEEAVAASEAEAEARAHAEAERARAETQARARAESEAHARAAAQADAKGEADGIEKRPQQPTPLPDRQSDRRRRIVFAPPGVPAPATLSATKSGPSSVGLRLAAGFGIVGGGGALSGLFASHPVWGIAIGLAAAVVVLVVRAIWKARSAEIPPIQVPVIAEPPTAMGIDMPSPKPALPTQTTPVVVITKLLPTFAEISIRSPAPGEPARGTASIAARGEWPALVGRDLEPALLALAEAPDRSIALDFIASCRRRRSRAPPSHPPGHRSTPMARSRPSWRTPGATSPASITWSAGSPAHDRARSP
ncbi:MAG: hypothetical protein E6J91_10100 [Deltaproteobacteria bacterium]|nr:MAG: hypothetical protein E6J91_10100 [Deltaproteobacteria bacterium]